jgi:hypothetical protein
VPKSFPPRRPHIRIDREKKKKKRKKKKKKKKKKKTSINSMSKTPTPLSRDDLGSLTDAHPDYIRDVLNTDHRHREHESRARASHAHWLLQRRASLFGVTLIAAIVATGAPQTLLPGIAVLHLLMCLIWRDDVTLSRVVVVAHIAALGVSWHDRWLRKFELLFTGFQASPVLRPLDQLLQAPFLGYLAAVTALTQLSFVARSNRDRLWLRVISTGPLLALVAMQHLNAAESAGQYFLHAQFARRFFWPRLVAWCLIGVSSIWFGAMASRAPGIDTVRVGLLWAIFNYLALWSAARFFAQ